MLLLCCSVWGFSPIAHTVVLVVFLKYFYVNNAYLFMIGEYKNRYKCVIKLYYIRLHLKPLNTHVNCLSQPAPVLWQGT